MEFLFELLLQAVGEILVEGLFRACGAPFNLRSNPWLAGIGYLLWGAILGGLSLLIFPNNLVPPEFRMANLIITPIVIGVMMGLRGKWRTRRGRSVLRLNRFSYGYLFALSLALVRFCFAG